MESFIIIRKCQSEYHTKIHEALLIKIMHPNSIVNFTPVEHLFCFKCSILSLWQPFFC